MQRVLGNILCDLDPKVKVKGKKAGICDGVPSTAVLVNCVHSPIKSNILGQKRNGAYKDYKNAR